MDRWSVFLQALAAVFVAAGGGGLIRALFRRWSGRPTKAQQITQLSEGALQYAERIRADAEADRAAFRKELEEARQDAEREHAALRKELAEARAEVQAINRSLVTAQRNAEELASYVAWVARSIHDPAMSLDRLRGLVPESGPNRS